MKLENNKNQITTNISKSETPEFFRFLANSSFTVFLFFSFFNTQMPFQPRDYDLSNVGDTNVWNQIIYTVLFFISAISLIPQKKNIVRFARCELFLTLFLLWCTLSIFWSDYSFIAFKRLFQFYTMILVFLAVFLYNDSPDKLIIYFKIILSSFLLLSLISVFTISGAIDPSAGTWRGVALSKNLLGQVATIGIIFWFNMLNRGTIFSKIYSGFLLIISVILLIGSFSMTSIVVLVLICILAILFSFERAFFYHLGIRNTYSVMLINSILIVLIVTYVIAPDAITALPNAVGKDISFTGRTELWKDIFREAKSYLLFGCGFKSFWSIDNPNILYIYEKYVWLPNQAHNGYLDLLNELGIIGLILFLLANIFYFKNLNALNQSHFWRWFFIAGLIINLQETTLFSVKHPSGVLLLFAYFALYAKLISQKELISQEKISGANTESNAIIQR